jgi:hypothetical protein
MNHYAVDTLAYNLERELHYARTVETVVTTKKFTTEDSSVFQAGDWLTITSGGGSVNRLVASVSGNEITLTVAVATLAPADTLVITTDPLPHAFHSYKAFDADTGEPPSLERPFILVAIPQQLPIPWLNKANVGFQRLLRDQTQAVIYVESRMAVDEAGTQYGGFDHEHLPAINLVRHFIQYNRTLFVPSALVTAFGNVAQIGMIPGSVPEWPVRFKDGERHLFNVVLTYFTVTPD